MLHPHKKEHFMKTSIFVVKGRVRCTYCADRVPRKGGAVVIHGNVAQWFCCKDCAEAYDPDGLLFKTYFAHIPGDTK